jgi:hypothetical protein
MLSNSRNIVTKWMNPPGQLLSTTLVKFEKSHGTFNEEWKKKPVVANDSYT